MAMTIMNDASASMTLGELNKNISEDASDICELMKDDMFSESTLDLVKKYSPKFNQALIKNDFESVLVCRIQKDDKVKGYLVWAVRRSLRIWQENECALIFYLAELLADEDFQFFKLFNLFAFL